jgi:hypothetical protein
MHWKLSRCALVILLGGATVSVAAHANGASSFAGRRVVEVLQDAVESGLRIVYSEAVVPADLRVLAEPKSADAVMRLREILALHALVLEELEPGSACALESLHAHACR